MDVADLADIEIERNSQGDVNRVRFQRPESNRRETLTPQGYCHNCFEDLEGDKLFCDSCCAKQHDVKSRLR